jgi:hypothetical protein
MTALNKGLVVAAIQVALVASLGAKLLVDRNTRPRIWVRTAPVDPNMPIRGRYLRLRIEATPTSDLVFPNQYMVRTLLSVKDGRLVASPDHTEASNVYVQPATRAGGERVVVLSEPVAYFISEHAVDPSRRPPGEELWVEVTVPRAGAPRPIQLGVKKDGMLTPLSGR